MGTIYFGRKLALSEHPKCASLFLYGILASNNNEITNRQGRQERQGKRFVQGFCVSPVPFGFHWDAPGFKKYKEQLVGTSLRHYCLIFTSPTRGFWDKFSSSIFLSRLAHSLSRVAFFGSARRSFANSARAEYQIPFWVYN